MELPMTILKYCAFMVFIPAVLSQNNGSSRELIVCRVPESFPVQVSDYHRVDVYANELLIRHKDVGLYLYPGTNTVSVVLNDTSIYFQAYMRAAYHKHDNIKPLAERIWWSNNGFITGFGKLQKINEGYYRVQNYSFYLPTNTSKSPNLFKKVEEEITRLARICLETEISRSTDNISEKSLNHFGKINDLGTVIILPQPAKGIVSNEINSPVLAQTDSLEFNINDLVDLGLGATIDMIKLYNLDKITLPDLNETFISDMKIFDVKGKLQASNGTFRGLTSLLRTADVVLSRQGRKYTASCGFGMTNAIIQYNKYKLKYGFMEMCGSIIGTTENIALESKISVDYDLPRCVTKLESIKITEFGRMKVNFTGTGVMNKVGSKLISWFTKIFKNYLKGIIERDLEFFLANRISSFDCERYRRKIL